MSKAKWFHFFEQAEAELGVDAPEDDLTAMADDLLADYEADRVDQAYEHARELGLISEAKSPTPPKPVDWR